MTDRVDLSTAVPYLAGDGLHILKQLHADQGIDGKAVTFDFAGIEMVARCGRVHGSTVEFSHCQLPRLLRVISTVLKAISLGEASYTSSGHGGDSDAPADRVLQPHDMARLTLSVRGSKAMLGVLGHTIDTSQVQRADMLPMCAAGLGCRWCTSCMLQGCGHARRATPFTAHTCYMTRRTGSSRQAG
jgi:hypothetical protein